MGAFPLYQMTEDEYLLFEQESDIRHEFYGGEVFDMAGGSVEHARVSGNAFGEIRARLKGKKCEVFGSDLRIQIEANGLFTYPDLSIVCGDLKRYKNRTDTITNPVVIIEVLSPSTADYDHGGKFELYRDIPTLKEYILIHATRIRVERFTRVENDQWLLNEHKTREESLHIQSIGEAIPLEELYSRVTFAQA